MLSIFEVSPREPKVLKKIKTKKAACTETCRHSERGFLASLGMISHKHSFYQLSVNTKPEREAYLLKKQYRASDYKSPILYSKPLGLYLEFHDFSDFWKGNTLHISCK